MISKGNKPRQPTKEPSQIDSPLIEGDNKDNF